MPNEGFLGAVQRLFVTYMGYLLILYAGSFILLAALRLVTGLSIKRFGYLSLRHVSFTPKIGIRVSIEKLGLALHRPTVARPSWFSVHMTNIDVKIDPRTLMHADEVATESEEVPKKERGDGSTGSDDCDSVVDDGDDGDNESEYDPSSRRNSRTESSDGVQEPEGNAKPSLTPEYDRQSRFRPPRSLAFFVVRFLIHYIKYFNFTATSVSVSYTGVATVIVGGVSVELDLRNLSALNNRSESVGTLDDYHLSATELPVSLKMYAMDCYVAPRADDELEAHQRFLDTAMFEMDGVLGKEDLSLRNLSLSTKIGNPVVSVAELLKTMDRFKALKNQLGKNGTAQDSGELKLTPTPSHSSAASQSSGATTPNLKNLAKIGSSIVRIVKEIEFRISSISLVALPIPGEPNATFATSARALNLDLRRLNPKSPGFKLFFSEVETAHQAVFSMSSFSFGIDQKGTHDELIYVPMVTMISKTNAFSRTLQLVGADDESTNRSVFRANVNVTCPTVDLEAAHVSLLVPLMRRQRSGFRTVSSGISTGPGSPGSSSASLAVGISKPNPTSAAFAESFQRLLPKVSIAFTIDEPAARLLLSPIDDAARLAQRRGMVISSSSKIHCDFESSHSEAHGRSDYEINTSLQITDYDTWFRSSVGVRYDLLMTELMTVKIAGSTNPKLQVSVTAALTKSHAMLVKGEVFEGLRDLVLHLNKGQRKSPSSSLVGPLSRRLSITQSGSENLPFIFKVPSWLKGVDVEVTDTAASIASETAQCGQNLVRGITCRISTFDLKYAAASDDQVPALADPRDQKLTVSLGKIEAYKVVEPHGLDVQPESLFLCVPELDLAFLGDPGDPTRPIMRASVVLPKLRAEYDLGVQFLCLLAASMIKRTMQIREDPDTLTETEAKPSPIMRATELSDQVSESGSDRKPPFQHTELALRTGVIRIKMRLPHEAHAMFESNALDVEKRVGMDLRFRAKYVRLYSKHPFVKDAWARIFSIRSLHGEVASDIGTNSRTEDVLLEFDGLRFNLPNQFLFYTVVDNLATTVKGANILVQAFKSGALEVSDRRPTAVPKERKKMPNIPRVRIRARKLLMAIEDDAFEARLNLILQLGLKEQALRLEKEQAFEEKVAAINESASDKSKSESRDSAGVKDSGGDRGRRPRGSSHDSKSRHAPSSSSEMPSPTSPVENQQSFAKEKRVRGFHLGPRRKGGQGPDYVLQQTQKFTSKATVSVSEAHDRLLRNFSSSWVRAYNRAYNATRRSVKENHEAIWGVDEVDIDTAQAERIVEYSDDALLFYSEWSGVDMLISRPTFDGRSHHQYLHDIGKGMPLDTRFSVLIPMHWELKIDEWRGQLRDYPLPLLHIPDLVPSQNAAGENLKSLHLSGNWVIAEEWWPSEDSMRVISVPIVPLAVQDPSHPELQKYIVDVCRTVSSVKMYTDLHLQVNTLATTRFTWCNSMSPAVRTVMLAFDGFSKPPVDQSPKLGFWDKMRAIFHARLHLSWKQGDVFLCLKGSRSPYDLLARNAGFVMCWRNNVHLNVNKDDDPQKLLVVESDDYILAVPDYAAAEPEYLQRVGTFTHHIASRPDLQKYTEFTKVCMKLSGTVSWCAGLMFERDDPSGKGRTSEFMPHYKVQLRRPSAKVMGANGSANGVVDGASVPLTEQSNGFKAPVYDAYSQFRSKYLHLAITVLSPQDHEHSHRLGAAPNSYNTIHLTPLTFLHFATWWALFDGSLSLPVKTGALFDATRTVKPAKPKLSRHLVTVKYKLVLSPLFLAHSYKHPHMDEDVSKKRIREASTGIKARIDGFMMDLHQRREKDENSARTHMKIHRGEFDFKGTDLRVILAQFKERAAPDLLAQRLGLFEEESRGTGSVLTEESEPSTGLDEETGAGSRTDTPTGPGRSASVDASNANASGATPLLSGKFKISDHDFSWIDMDDYHELDDVHRWRHVPKIVVLPLLYAPRWTYFRQTDAGDPDDGLTFGNEPVHDCLIGRSHPETTQAILLRQRVEELDEQLKTLDASIESLAKDLELFPAEPKISQRLNSLRSEYKSMARRKEVILEVLQLCRRHGPSASEAHTEGGGLTEAETEAFLKLSLTSSTNFSQSSFENLDKVARPDEGDFSNRFIVHNVQIKWNNAVRNAVYRYMHQVSDRRAFSYFLTRRAVQYLEELVAQQEANLNGASSSGENVTTPSEKSSCLFANDKDSSSTHSSLGNLNNLQHKTCSFRDLISTTDQQDNQQDRRASADLTSEERVKAFDEQLHAINAETEEPQDTYLVRLTSPQIQLVSDQNEDQCVLVTSQNIELKIVSVWDKDTSADDEVSGLVETRYGVVLQDAQFFVLSRSDVEAGSIALFSANSYGCGRSMAWPPWLTVECCYDSSPLRNALVVDKTTVTMRYDRPNSLRVGSGDGGGDNMENHTAQFCAAAVRLDKYRPNRVLVDFPRVIATCDSKQYFAVYTIVVDLLVYSEPNHKKATDRLEAVLLTTDFSDLRGALDRLKKLQVDIRRLWALREELGVRVKCQLVRGSTSSSQKSSNAGIDPSAGSTAQVDLTTVELELWHVALELVVMMRAIKSGMNKNHEDNSSLLKWSIAADQIVWHALSEDRQPFLDIGLADASFNRLENGDGFNTNTVEVGMMQAFNLLPGTLYPELVSPYFADNQHELAPGTKLARVKWTMLDPIGGIPIMDNLDVLLAPLKLQLEKKTGQKLFEYVFPPSSENESPFLVNNLDRKRSEEEDFLDDDEEQGESSSDEEYMAFYSGTDDKSSVSSQVRPMFQHRREMAAALQEDSMGSSLGAGSTAAASSVGNSSKRSSSPSRSVNSRMSGSTGPHRMSFDSVRPKSRTDHKNSHKKDKEESDELKVMLKRASNYVSIVNIQVHSVTLCVSYKGPGARNLTDIHEFVISLPGFTYKNKTWSNLDLALHIKKDIVRTLFQHSGALIGHKLTRHKKTPLSQPLRQIQNYVSFTSVSDLAGGSNGNESRRPSLATTPSRPGVKLISPDERSQTLLNGSDTASSHRTSLGGSPDVSKVSNSPLMRFRRGSSQDNADLKKLEQELASSDESSDEEIRASGSRSNSRARPKTVSRPGSTAGSRDSSPFSKPKKKGFLRKLLN